MFMREVACQLPSLDMRVGGTRIKHIETTAAGWNKPETLWWGGTTTGRCENAYLIDGAIYDSAEYRLKLTYYVIPWPFRITANYTYIALIERGKITNWVTLNK